MDELDLLFGRSRPATTVRIAEGRFRPSHVFSLGRDTVGVFNGMLRLASESQPFATLALGTCILWVVDDGGTVRLCLEEVCSDFGRRFPRMRFMPLHASLQALGHPSLVGRVSARIAGELVLDDDNGRFSWVLTNKSGRYGGGPDREPVHLHNVASLFAAAGLDVQTEFLTWEGS